MKKFCGNVPGYFRGFFHSCLYNSRNTATSATCASTTSSPKSISCYSFNARSLRNKLPEFLCLLQLETYDIIFVTETWLDDRLSDSFIVRNSGYSVFRKDRSALGGGSAIFAKNSLKCLPVSIPSSFSDIEATGVDLMLSGSLKYRLVCVYFPPSAAHSDLKVKQLCSFIEFGCNTSSIAVFVGDYNFPSIDWLSLTTSGDSLHDHFLSNCIKLSLSQMVFEPTRINNVLGLILTTCSTNIHEVSVTEPFSSTCDHNAITFLLVGCPDRRHAKQAYAHNFFKADYVAIKSVLADIDWYRLFLRRPDVQSFWNEVCRILHEIISRKEFVPLKRKNNKFTLPRYLRRLSTKKRKLYKKVRADPSLL